MKQYCFALVIIIFLSLIIAGCATRGEVNRFKMQLDYLEASNASLDKKITVIDSLVRVQNRLIRQMHAEQLNSFVLLQEELQIVEGILRESGHQVSYLSNKMENIRDDIISSRRALGDTTLTDSLGDSIGVSNAPNPAQIFKTANLDLTKGNYKLAMIGFQQYLNLAPNGDFADDAQYGVGECLFLEGKYSEAIPEYLILEAQYPESEFTPSALYKIGLCYIKMDNKQMARKFFKAVKNSYPLSNEAKPAEQKLKDLE
ncbi:tol-pal system protein YbgF [bacterium]|nr:tol-pal system protein YbgF [bacterium]